MLGMKMGEACGGVVGKRERGAEEFLVLLLLREGGLRG